MDGVSPAVATVTADRVQDWLISRSHRFLSLTEDGWLDVSLDQLAVMLTEYLAELVGECTEVLRAELDAANDAVTELVGQVQECRRVLDGGVGA